VTKEDHVVLLVGYSTSDLLTESTFDHKNIDICNVSLSTNALVD
jgi:hypothetical protein